MKTSGEFHSFDQAGEAAGRNRAPPGIVLWHLTLRITHSVEAEAQRGDLNPGKAQALPSLHGLPSVIPSAPLVGYPGREAAGAADGRGRGGLP